MEDGNQQTETNNNQLKINTGEGGSESKKKKTKSVRKKFLGDREIEVLKLCYEQGFVTRGHLKKWMDSRFRMASLDSAKTVSLRALHFLRDQKLIEFFPTYNGQHREAARITAKGLGLLLDRRCITPQKLVPVNTDPDQISHDLLVTEIRIMWSRLMPSAGWCSERLLKSEDRDRIPDAVLSFFFGGLLKNYSIAIEVELTQKSRSRYFQKIQSYENSAFDFIFYFTSGDAISAAIHEVSKDITTKVFTCSIDEFLDHGSEACFVSHQDHFKLKERFPCV